jgi:hypothetical protein
MAQTFKITDGDISINSANGRGILISGAEKIHQDIAEFFEIEILSNGFGAGLEQLIGTVDVSPEVFVLAIDRQIKDGLASFIKLIHRNSRTPRSSIEKIIGISNIQVSSDSTDPTKFYFQANIITEAGPLSFISDSIVTPT